MNQAFLILADDLSGAADCAAGFARAGLDSTVLLVPATAPVDLAATVLTIDTDSRRDDAPTAARRSQAAWRRHGDGRRLFKKIDSTLRGTWVAEVAALQPLLGLALVAPAFAEMGRTLQDGVLHVDGTPLGQTGTWQLEHAGCESEPLRMLQAAGMACEPVASTWLDGAAPALRQHIRQAQARGCQALVFDSTTAAQLRALATATQDMPGVFWVGSAGLSRELAAVTHSGGHHADAVPPSCDPAPAEGQGVLVVVGSMSDVARRQIACLKASAGTRLHTLAAATLREPPARGAAPAAWALAVVTDLRAGRDPVLCIEASGQPDPAEGPLLARHLAQHLEPALRTAAGLVLTGGETARAMLAHLGIDRLRILAEIEPGVVLSRSLAARSHTIATKAGAFGHAASLEQARQAVRACLANSPVHAHH